MIIDLPRFIAVERPFWTELERALERLGADPTARMSMEELRRFHYLYEKVSADLAKLASFAAEPELRRYLESLTARAYAEIHETRERRTRFALGKWFAHTFPQTFQRRIRQFWLSCLVMFVGAVFGGAILKADPDAKESLMPFDHLTGSPSERVAEEEEKDSRTAGDRLEGRKATFSAVLMENNIRVSILTLALGVTWGLGTCVLLFYNGVILGLVAVDYVADGQMVFLLGWLMPHGVIEIPAVLIAGQAGLLLGKTLIGSGDRTPLRERLRQASPDLVTLIFGVAVLLVWAGLVEAFFSQYHQPVVPYAVKIAFGCAELILLVAFLWRKRDAAADPAAAAAPPFAP